MKRLFLLLILSPIGTVAQNCDALIKEIDKFTGRLSVKTPILKDVTFFKYVLPEEDTTLFTVKLTAYSNSVHLGKGIIILFENGMKIEDTELEIKVDVNTDYPATHKFRVTAYVPIKRSDLDTFSKYKIMAYRLYIHDVDVKDNRGNKYREYAYCLFHSK